MTTLEKQIAALKSDCLTLALRLMGESPDTFAPETREVMRRWLPECMALFKKTETTRPNPDREAIPFPSLENPKC